MKNQEIQSCTISVHASWSYKKSSSKENPLTSLGGWESVTKGGKFSISSTYELLIAGEDKVHRGNIMIRNGATQSAKFITWFAVQNRLSTKDHINRWMGDCGLDCSLCNNGQETLHHLLFECENAKQVRKGIFSFLDNNWHVRS